MPLSQQDLESLYDSIPINPANPTMPAEAPTPPAPNLPSGTGEMLLNSINPFHQVPPEAPWSAPDELPIAAAPARAPAPVNPIVAKYLAPRLAPKPAAAESGDEDEESDDSSPATGSSDALPSSQAAPIPASSSGDSLNPMVARYLANLKNSREELGSAQAAANQNQLYAGLARAAGTLSHALSRSTQPMDESGFNALDKQAGSPVQAVEAQQAADQKGIEAQASAQGMQLKDLQTKQTALALKKSQEETDPNSPESQAFRKSVEKLAPGIASQYGALWSQVTAADQDKILKPIELKEQIDARKQTASLAHDYKLHDKENAALQNTQGILESTRGSPAVAQAEKDIYAAQKANTLMNLYGDPNKLNPQMAKLVVAEIGKIASGGQSSEAELNAITPSTLHGTLAGAWQRVSGDPTPANLGSFLKQYQDYSNQITKDAQSVIQDRYGRVIQARAQQLGPQNTKALQDQYLNRFTQEKPIQLGQAAPMPAHPSGARPGDTVRVAGKLYTVGADGNSLTPVQ